MKNKAVARFDGQLAKFISFKAGKYESALLYVKKMLSSEDWSKPPATLVL
jgi:hypothetical protein